jgi:hypothetical protein
MRRPCPTGVVAPNKKYDYITMHCRKNIKKVG